MINSLFSVPLLTLSLDSHLADYMENLVTPKLPKLHYLKEENVYSDYNQPNKLIKGKDLKKFTDIVNPICKKFASEVNISLENPKIDYWLQDYKSNQSMELHSHPGSLLSGVYYIRANENAGSISFQNPNPYLYFQKHIDKSRMNYNHTVKPQKGMLILFPGYLFHKTIPSKNPNVQRTVLAFNF
mgnify:CR=1 FL=1|tara:strand:- start:479 stop:1033 length:555 start_codon:yes stop_codon:yes gene_type:complete